MTESSYAFVTGLPLLIYHNGNKIGYLQTFSIMDISYKLILYSLDPKLSNKILHTKRTSEGVFYFFEPLSDDVIQKAVEHEETLSGSYQSTESNIPTRIQHICQYVADHYAEPLSLKEVAEQAYYSPEAFCRYFKKYMGITFVDYLSRIRVVESCRMLKANVGEQNIYSIAYACGFGSISNFNRTFKRVMGISPTTFLKQDSKILGRSIR